MQWDFSKNFTLFMPNTEAVTFTSVRVSPPGAVNVAQAVTNAKRRALTTKELAASYGAYESGDLNWHLPNTQMAGLVPKPRDTVTDGQGVVYTVLSADQNVFRSVHKLTCRNLIISAQLFDSIDLQQPLKPERQDLAAGRLVTFVPGYVALACRVQETTGHETDERGQRMLERLFTVFLSQQVVITTEWRANWNGQTLDILDYYDPQRIDELPKLHCRLVT